MPNTFVTASGNQTLDRFLAAGVEAVAKFGVDNLSVQFISDLAKGSRPTFYSYFGDVNGLLAEIWVSTNETWLKLITNPKVGYTAWSKSERMLHEAVSEILAVAHRIPEVREVVYVSMASWWRSLSSDSELEKLKVLWLMAERLGVVITNPVDPDVHQAEFVENAISSLTPEVAVQPKTPLQLPKLSDPEFQEESLDIKLLNSTIFIIANSGVNAASMARIARRTQVSTGAVYPRFANNDEIVEKSFELAIAQVVKQNFAAVGNMSFSPEDFGAIILAGLDESRQVWRNFRIEIHLGAQTRPELRKRMKKNLRETNALVAQGLFALNRPDLVNGPVPYLMHAVGIGFAILQNAGIPVAKLDHRTLTVGLTRLLAG